MDSKTLSSNVKLALKAQSSQGQIRGLSKPIINEKFKSILSYMKSEAEPAAIEAAYPIYFSYMSDSDGTGELPSPMEPLSKYENMEIVKLILQSLKLNKRTFNNIFEGVQRPWASWMLDGLSANPHLTLEQTLLLLKHKEVLYHNKKRIVEKFSREIIESLLDEPWEFKYLLCESPVLTEAEVREFASFHPTFLYNLLDNPLTPIELIYEDTLVDRNLEDANEPVELRDLQITLMNFRWNDFKVFLSQKYNLDLEPYDKHWVMRFLNWDFHLADV